jgi:tartrate dehydrogenase/decarboxylase/D-malate dehydrogenase
MEATLAKPETRTRDLGGTASTGEVTDALVSHLPTP